MSESKNSYYIEVREKSYGLLACLMGAPYFRLGISQSEVKKTRQRPEMDLVPW